MCSWAMIRFSSLRPSPIRASLLSGAGRGRPRAGRRGCRAGWDPSLLSQRDGADIELDPDVLVGGRGRVSRVQGRPVAVDRVQVEGGVAGVAQVVGDLGRGTGARVGSVTLPSTHSAVGVGGQVVVDELAPVGVDRRDGRVLGALEGVGREAGSSTMAAPSRFSAATVAAGSVFGR